MPTCLSTFVLFVISPVYSVPLNVAWNKSIESAAGNMREISRFCLRERRISSQNPMSADTWAVLLVVSLDFDITYWSRDYVSMMHARRGKRLTCWKSARTAWSRGATTRETRCKRSRTCTASSPPCPPRARCWSSAVCWAGCWVRRPLAWCYLSSPLEAPISILGAKTSSSGDSGSPTRARFTCRNLLALRGSVPRDNRGLIREERGRERESVRLRIERVTPGD